MTTTAEYRTQSLQAEKDFQKMAAANELIEALIDMLENGDARSRQMARAALRKAGVTV